MNSTIRATDKPISKMVASNPRFSGGEPGARLGHKSSPRVSLPFLEYSLGPRSCHSRKSRLRFLQMSALLVAGVDAGCERRALEA
jgi:hypothetical protein